MSDEESYRTQLEYVRARPAEYSFTTPEAAIDRCENVANIIEGVIIKHS